MSKHDAKFVKVVPLSEGKSLIRDGNGTWNLHYSGGKPERREISTAQAEFIDAAIVAGMSHVRGSK